MANPEGTPSPVFLARIRLASQSIPGRLQAELSSAPGRNACILPAQEILIPDSTPATDAIEPTLEIPAERLVLGPSCRFRPDRTEPSHQSRNPVGRLERLMAVAFQMERRLDEMPAPLVPRVHAARGLGDQRRALLVLVEDQGEVLRRVAVLGAKPVNPPNGLPPVSCERVRSTPATEVHVGGR